MAADFFLCRMLCKPKMVFTLLGSNLAFEWINCSRYRAGPHLDFLFGRYFSYQFNLLDTSMFLATLLLCLFAAINSFREDSRKFGLFYLTRYSRKRYAAGKCTSLFGFTFFAAFVTVGEGFLIQRASGICFPAGYYLTVFFTFWGTVLVYTFAASALYLLLQNDSNAFLISAVCLAASRIICSGLEYPFQAPAKHLARYAVSGVLSAALMGLVFAMLQKADFLSTKVKE